MVAQFSYTRILNSGLSVNPQDNAVIRNQTDDGYVKQFNRFTADYITYGMEYLLTATQYAAFITWWKTNKAIEFDFKDPVDDATYQGRIVSGKFSASPHTTKQSHYVVGMDVERII